MDKRGSEINEDVNNNTTLTFGNLFQQDLPQACIFPIMPNSLDAKSSLKSEKYRIFNIPATSKSVRCLASLRCVCVAGNELPILVHQLPHEFLFNHWKKWCPNYVDPVVKTIEEEIEGNLLFITLFPTEEIPVEKHAIDPETHYSILEKIAIADTGAPHPKYFQEDNVEFPCMIKVCYIR